jgi:hypothetical protein
MLKFKDFISEEQVYFNKPELESEIGTGGVNAVKNIMKHPFFKDHIINQGFGIEPKFRYSKMSDNHHIVDAISTPNKYVSFHLITSGAGKTHRVMDAHLFRWDGKSKHHDGRKIWAHDKSYNDE